MLRTQSRKPFQKVLWYRIMGSGRIRLVCASTKRFGEFVNGAHAAGHDDIRERILYKHELAQEEVAVITAYFYILIAFLFVGKLDMQADGRSSGLGGSLVALLP